MQMTVLWETQNFFFSQVITPQNAKQFSITFQTPTNFRTWHILQCPYIGNNRNVSFKARAYREIRFPEVLYLQVTQSTSKNAGNFNPDPISYIVKLGSSKTDGSTDDGFTNRERLPVPEEGILLAGCCSCWVNAGCVCENWPMSQGRW